jgi:hypothetical protein
MRMKKWQKILNKLTNSLKLPKRYKNKSLRQIIINAKKKYFESKIDFK